MVRKRKEKGGNSGRGGWAEEMEPRSYEAEGRNGVGKKVK